MMEIIGVSLLSIVAIVILYVMFNYTFTFTTESSQDEKGEALIKKIINHTLANLESHGIIRIADKTELDNGIDFEIYSGFIHHEDDRDMLWNMTVSELRRLLMETNRTAEDKLIVSKFLMEMKREHICTESGSDRGGS